MLLAVESDADAARAVDAAREAKADIAWLRAVGRDGILSALKTRPDALLCDYKTSVLACVKSMVELVEKSGLAIPIIVIAGGTEDGRVAECLSCGAADYLHIDRLARLGGAIEAAVERYRGRARLREAEQRLLAVAVNVVAINDMRRRSLPGDPSELSIRTILEPLFDYDALPGLQAVTIELPHISPFRIDRDPGMPADESASRLIRREIDGGRGGSGYISFMFGSDPGTDRESAQFLDEVAQVISEAIKQSGTEKTLLQSLEEKDELLREIHHRVKNNLQSMQGLVSLAASRLPEGPGHEALKGLESQVQSMALVHGMLYSRDSFTGIDFEEYFHALKTRVGDARGRLEHRLSLSTECRGFRIPLEAAVTLGILFNELLHHAVGFAASLCPVQVSVAARREEDGCWRIEYRELYTPPYLGLELAPRDLEFARLLLPQYEGSIEVDSGGLLVKLCVACNAIERACP